MAKKIVAYKPGVIVTSTELKAIETGTIISEHTGLAIEIAENLHEHDRTGVSFFSDIDEFMAHVYRFFAEPDRLVFGNETANEAHQRFHVAIAGILARYPRQSIAVVAHGTVISLYVSRLLDLDPYPFWERLTQPSFVVLDRLNHELVNIVFAI